jgi:Flp pilus assembly pilin Flp
MTNAPLGIRSLLLAAALVGFAAAACDGGVLKVVDGGAGSTGNTGSPGDAGTTGNGGTGGTAGTGGAAGPAVCATPIGSRLYPDTTDEVIQALKGRWTRCGHALTSDASEVGLEIADDLHYWVLVPGPNGSVVRSTSLFELGQVVVTELGTVNGHLAYRTEFVADANIAYQVQVMFTTDVPRKWFTTNTDMFWQIYVQGDPGDVIGGSGGAGAATGGPGGSNGTGASGGTGGPGGSSGSGVCATPIGARLYTDTVDEINAAVKGRWVRCGHALTSDQSEVGLEVADDLRFWVLIPGPNGSVVRSTSLFGYGQVIVTPLGTFNGHLSFDMDFITEANGGGARLRPLFTTDVPRKMVTTNTDIFWQIYVHEDP